MKTYNVEYHGSIIRDKIICWFFNGKGHRDGDLPTELFFKDKKPYYVAYFRNGNLHRTTGPAVIDYEDEIKEYFYRGTEYASLEEIKMVEACK